MKLYLPFACGLLAASSLAFASGNYTNSFDTVSRDTSAIAAMKSKSSIGIGVATFEQLYTGLDRRTTALPLINVRYNKFFFKGFNVGADLVQKDHFTASFIVKPMFNGYQSDDSNELAGMEDRKISAFAGGQVQYRLKPLNLTMYATQDVTGRTGGYMSGVTLGTGLPLMGGRVVVIPSVGASYWSSDVVDYYYGVKDSEATSTRAAYSPDGTMVYHGTVNTIYRFNDSWLGRLTYNYSYFGEEVDDSPITDKRRVNTVLLGLSYLF